MSPDRPTPLRVAIVNDYELIVSGLRAMLEPFRDRVVVVETEAGGTPDQRADIVLYTWDVSDSFLADIDRSHIDGVILKAHRGAQLVDALERVGRGEDVGSHLLVDESSDPELSERELEVLALLARGLSNRQIAAELYLSVETVKTHARTLFRKLEVNNRTQAALIAPRFGVEDPTRRIA